MSDEKAVVDAKEHNNQATSEDQESTASSNTEANSDSAPNEAKEQNSEAPAESADLATVQDENSVPDESEQKSAAEAKKPRKNKSWLSFVFGFVLFLAMLMLAASGVYFYKQLQQGKDTQASTINELSEEITSLQQRLSALNDSHKRFSVSSTEDRAVLRSGLEAAELRLTAQQKRILAMSTTSREDWLLAEAEYLLRLANQRVLIERKADSAIALFEEADSILLELGEPDLFPLREAIKKDLVALKLARSIDVEGIYLELNALITKVDELPLVPEAFNYAPVDQEQASAEQQAQDGAIKKFFESFKQYVRVINHEEKPKAILPPDATAYLHLNLRLMLEQAQLALLREQENIYFESLQEAEKWLIRYFPSSQALEQYRVALEVLAAKKVVTVLPDVSTSLTLLDSYISDLHKIGPQGSGSRNANPSSVESNLQSEAL